MLHYLGFCHRTPGIDYLLWEALWEDEPDGSLYDACSRQCWSSRGAASEESGTESSSEEQGREAREQDGALPPVLASKGSRRRGKWHRKQQRGERF